MNRFHLILTCLLFCFFSVSTTFFLLLPLPVEIITIPSSLSVHTIIGLNSNNTALTFGRVPPGASSSRIINITNNQIFPVRYFFSLDAPYAFWTSITPSTGTLAPGETALVAFAAVVPLEASEMNYTGSATLIFSQQRYKIIYTRIVT